MTFGEKLFILGILLPFIGLFSFIVGFMVYREYRLVEDTPLARIHGIPMGLVHIRGRAIGEHPLLSPLTHTPCFAYHVLVEKYDKDATVLKWVDLHTTKAQHSFYLDDGTAKILVNPESAEFDVTQTFVGAVGPHAGNTSFLDASLGKPGPTEEDLRSFLVDKRHNMALDRAGALKDQTYRLTEHCLIANREHILLGTCAENPSPADERDRKMILKGQNEKTFVITSKSEKEAESSLKGLAWFLVVAGVVMIASGVAFWLFIRRHWND